MGDEAQKRNTDCVYFLASPLTCKKGNECEYRHSEAARVNPRDCWFWVTGCCLNANCSFRHPPLEVRTTPASPSVPIGTNSNTTTVTSGNGSSASTSAAPTAPAPAPNKSKVQVPCFYHSQGFCARGIKCSFMHGPPMQFRKESMTYRKPPTNEQQSGQEGNGLLTTKQQPQESKVTAQAVKGHPYAASGKPPVLATGDKEDHGRSNPSQKASIQSRLNSEVQENVSQNSQSVSRELHAGDLRNRLVKRRRNEGKEQSENVETALVSKVDSKVESVSSVGKRTKQEKDESNFSGPKSLAQIKAEKRNAAVGSAVKSDLDSEREKTISSSDDSQCATNGNDTIAVPDVSATRRNNGVKDGNNPSEFGYASADDLMDEGNDATDADYNFDDDEDDFAKKLGSFL